MVKTSKQSSSSSNNSNNKVTNATECYKIEVNETENRKHGYPYNKDSSLKRYKIFFLMQTEGKWCIENVKLLEAIIIGFISSDLIFILSHILLYLFVIDFCVL